MQHSPRSHHPTTIIQLNNEAGSHINNCNYEEAISLLRRALVLNKCVLDGANRSHCCGPGFQYSSNNCGMLFSRGLIHECMVTCAPSNIAETNQQCCCFRNDFIYRRPIIVPMEKALPLTKFIADFHTTLSIFVVFNLALAHHLSALKKGSCNVVGLEKAISLYGLAQRILPQQVTEWNILFVLASTNNVGQIRKALGQHDIANHFFRHMLSTLVYLSDSKFVDSTTFSLEGFYHNTAHLVLSNSNTAQAA